MTVTVTLNNVTNLQDTTSSQNVINNNSTAITTGFGLALNTSGDTMSGNIDMDSNRITNLPAPVSSDEPVRLIDLTSGIEGEALTTVSDTNVTLSTGGTPGTALLEAASITAGWSGTLSPTRGGTGSNLSTTGGTSQVLQQTSTGADVTVAQLSTSSLSDVSTPQSWTPTDQSGASLSFTSVSAMWCKIGNMIFAYGTFTYPSTSNGDNATISLPVAVPNQTYAAIPSVVIDRFGNGDSFVPNTNTNPGTATLINSSSGSARTNANVSTKQINFLITYPAS